MNRILLLFVLCALLIGSPKQIPMMWYTLEFDNGCEVSFNAISSDFIHFYNSDGELIQHFDKFADIHVSPEIRWIKQSEPLGIT